MYPSPLRSHAGPQAIRRTGPGKVVLHDREIGRVDKSVSVHIAGGGNDQYQQLGRVIARLGIVGILVHLRRQLVNSERLRGPVEGFAGALSPDALENLRRNHLGLGIGERLIGDGSTVLSHGEQLLGATEVAKGSSAPPPTWQFAIGSLDGRPGIEVPKIEYIGDDGVVGCTRVVDAGVQRRRSRQPSAAPWYSRNIRSVGFQGGDGPRVGVLRQAAVLINKCRHGGLIRACLSRSQRPVFL